MAKVVIVGKLRGWQDGTILARLGDGGWSLILVGDLWICFDVGVYT